MNILHYIKGSRRGKEAHRIELEALRDIFLSEALEGYDAIEDNHLKRIAYLQKQVENYCHKKNKMIAPVAIKPAPKQTPKKPKNIPWKKWSVAAIFLLCLALGGYYIIENHESLFKFRSAVLSGYQKRKDSVENEISDTFTLKVRQDTLLIYMPPPVPKKNPIAYWRTSQDNFSEDSGEDRTEVEVPKSEDAPQTQSQVPVVPESESGTENGD